MRQGFSFGLLLLLVQSIAWAHQMDAPNHAVGEKTGWEGPVLVLLQ